MGKSTVVQSVEEVVDPVLRSGGLELVDIEYKREGKNWVLRIFMDKEGGITVEDCQMVSREIGDLIEIEGLITTPYVLEVSSAGLDRTLKKEKDFLKFKGRKVRVSTYSPIDNRKNFKGILKDFQAGVVFLSLEGIDDPFKIPLENISKAKLEIEI